MEKCWGTPVADRQNSMRYYMIQDGCPVKGDTSLTIRSNGNSLQGKFDIKMFKFIGDDLNDVWLHCTVRACDASTPGMIDKFCYLKIGQNLDPHIKMRLNLNFND